jgi:hypothetical protein
VTGTIPYDDAVIFGTLVIHSTVATVLYDPHTTHSFISAQFATKYGIFKCPLRSRKTISAPEGKMLVNYICPKVSVKINGIDFPADLIVIETMGKDVILGKNRLQRTKAIIQHTVMRHDARSSRRRINLQITSFKEAKITCCKQR